MFKILVRMLHVNIANPKVAALSLLIVREKETIVFLGRGCASIPKQSHWILPGVRLVPMSIKREFRPFSGYLIPKLYLSSIECRIS